MSAFELTQRNQWSSRLLFGQHGNAVEVTLWIPMKTNQLATLLTIEIYNAVMTRIFKLPEKLSLTQQHTELASVRRHSHLDKRKQFEETAAST